MEKAIRDLEFNKIIELLKDNAITVMGKEFCSKIMPSNKFVVVKKLQTETSQALSLILKKNSLPITDIKDIRNILKRVELDGILSCEELLAVSDFLNVMQKIKLYCKDYDGVLNNFFSKIKLLNELKSEIDSKINGSEIADDASANLFELRRKIKFANAKIKEILNEMINKNKNMLQNNIIYVKNNRYCLSVRYEFKNSFHGVVHEQSASGLTFFIEPYSVVNLNNEIKNLSLLEYKEIQKILKQLSMSVANNFDSLSQNVWALGSLDFIFARAKLSILMNATEPILNENGYINLKRARHPLINSPVPLDIYLGEKFSTLLITGPNTGGKTVSLKTVGLFALMTQSGLHIPADENSQISVFENIFVDIGDEQSIQQNLSTFSAHMKNISQIINLANENSLILLDELGAGTDPVEGAALAIAILEHLFSLKAKIIVTSHYSELKLYAMTTDGVENAACEFDVETLSPTYRLLIGTPGKSNAFAISKKIGLNPKIIDAAKKNLRRRDIQFEDVMKNLNEKQLEIKIKSEQAEKLFSEAETLKKRFDSELEKFRLQKEKELQNAKQQALNIINSAREKSDLMLKNYRQNNFKAAEKIKSQLKNETENLVNVPRKNNDKVLVNINVGDKFFSQTLNQICVVKTLPNTEKIVTVSTGVFTTKVPVSDLKICNAEKNVKPEKNFVVKKSFDISSKIDVRGCNCDEALALIDKYIDDAVIAKLDEIMIIHGKGTGALRKAISDYLKKNSLVKNFRAGNFTEGDLGVTIVNLK